MIFIALIAFISLFGLIILHELGHFILARRFGVLVEEFGVGLPPRLFGKKIGETVYSLNLLPLGGFVRLYGEEKDELGPRSFSGKPVLQRALIVGGGIASFWIIAALIFSFLTLTGMPSVIEDADTVAQYPHVQVVGVALGSPAKRAGLKEGDSILQIKSPTSGSKIIERVQEVQELAEENRGKEIVLTIRRGKDVFDISLTPRTQHPAGEGPIGIALIRVGLVSYPWWEAPFRGIQHTIDQSFGVVRGWSMIFAHFFREGSFPPGAQVAGPVGIFSLFTQAGDMGIPYLMRFIAIIAIYLAFFNALPIPAVDGGKLLFLCLEAVRRKPMSRELEQKITAAFFLLLISLLIFVTIQDISRLL